MWLRVHEFAKQLRRIFISQCSEPDYHHYLCCLSNFSSCGDPRYQCIMATVAPLVWGFHVLMLVSVLYEPLRMSLHRLGQSIGGVGGVGGLTNQWNPSTDCSTTRGGEDAPWCFQPGWLGLTPFAGIILAIFTAPLAISAAVSHGVERTSALTANTTGSSTLPVTASKSTPSTLAILSVVWFTISILWFVVPLAAYLSSPFFQIDGWHILCGIAISSAFPLSWHLSFVAIPASAAGHLMPLTGMSVEDYKLLHKRIAWSTVGWTVLHASGEIVYLLSQHVFAPSMSLKTQTDRSHDNLIFVLGLTTFIVFLVHVVLAKMRRHPIISASFRHYHRNLAAVVVALASAHWWPFVFFLMPAVACTATGCAVRSAGEPRHFCARYSSLALACAILASVIGMVLVWALREVYMLGHPTDFVTPFVFPPLTLASSYMFARIGATSVLRSAHRTFLHQSTSTSSSAYEIHEIEPIRPRLPGFGEPSNGRQYE